MTSSASSVTQPQVKANDFQRQWQQLGQEIIEAVRAVGESGWYILGPEVERFERNLAAFWGRQFAVGVASGLDAIEIGLRCLGCRPGDKVLMPPVSAFATALAAIRIGAHPVFVDCDRFGLMDLDAAQRALSADHSIKYAVPVHLYGHCMNMERLADLKKRYGLRIVEDCAQSIGASHRGISCGAAGDCAATSFYPTKNLGAFGDGGALLTNSEALTSQARSLRDYGQVSKYRHACVGYNSRLDELHAAIMDRVLLPRIQEWNAARRRTAQSYLSGIRNPVLTVCGAPEGSDSCWHLFPVLAPPGRKTEFLAHLRAKGIGAGEHYPLALMDQPVMAEAPHILADDCATARDLCAREVSLPMHPYLEAVEIQRVIDACNSFS